MDQSSRHNLRYFAALGILIGLLMVQACGRRLPSEEACNFVQNSDKRRVSWSKDLPVEIYLDKSVSSDFVGPVQAAINKWNVVGQNTRGADFFRLKGGSPGAESPEQDGYSTIYVMNNWEPSKASEQARTTIHWSGSRIYEADMRLNDLNYNFSIAAQGEERTVHLESLIIHELGHVLGLAHIDSTNSVMQTSLSSGRVRAEIGSDDIESLKCEY